MTERIDFTKSEQYTLSIRLSADGFSFSIYNPLTDNDFCFVPYPVNTGYSMTANLKEMLTETETLRYPYKRVNILYDSPRFTPVPLELFEDEQMDTVFYHNFPKGNNEIVLCISANDYSVKGRHHTLKKNMECLCSSAAIRQAIKTGPPHERKPGLKSLLNSDSSLTAGRWQRRWMRTPEKQRSSA